MSSAVILQSSIHGISYINDQRELGKFQYFFNSSWCVVPNKKLLRRGAKTLCLGKLHPSLDQQLAQRQRWQERRRGGEVEMERLSDKHSGNAAKSGRQGSNNVSIGFQEFIKIVKHKRRDILRYILSWMQFAKEFCLKCPPFVLCPLCNFPSATSQHSLFISSCDNRTRIPLSRSVARIRCSFIIYADVQCACMVFCVGLLICNRHIYMQPGIQVGAIS